MVKLVIKKGDKLVKEMPLGENALSIGNAKDSEIYLAWEGISPEHAVISTLGNKILIEDIGSETGTFLNGSKISTSFVNVGDVITIGPFSIKIEKEKEKIIAPSDAGEARNPALRDWLLGGDDQKKAFPKEASKREDEKTEVIKEESVESNDLDKKQQTKKISPEEIDTVVIPLSPNPRLYAINLKGEKKFFPLDKDETVIGRASDADIAVDDFSLSLRHAIIIKADNSFSIIDQESTNGIKVNGEAVREKVIRCHDIIEVGNIKFEFLEGAVEPLSESESPALLKETTNKYEPDVLLTTDKAGTKKLKTQKQVKSTFQPKRRHLYLSALLIIVLAVLIFTLLKDKFQKPATIPLQGQTPKITTQEEAQKERLTLHYLTRAKRFINEKRYEEAKKELKLVFENVDPGNKEALNLYSNIEAEEIAQKQKTEEEKRMKMEKEAKISSLLNKGKNLLDKNNLKEAQAVFKEILNLDEENKIAIQYLSQIKALKIRFAKEREILKRKLKEIESLYYQGVSYYEEGNYDAAAEVLRKVVDFRTSNFYQSSAKILAEIEKKQMSDIEDQLSEVDSLIKNEELLKAENILRSILKRYPESAKAKEIFFNVHSKLVDKAKKIYGEGLVYEEVVDDTKSAVESYEEVLKLLPDPNEEYHKKAKSKLEKLK